MTAFEFFVFLGFALWILIHSRRANQRIEELEKRLEELGDGRTAETRALGETPLARAKREASEPPGPEAAGQAAPPPAPAATPPPMPPTERPAGPRPGLVPRPAPEPRREPAPPRRPPQPVREWKPVLEKLKLWPPSGENAEAAIGAWWMSRLGLIVLIIGAVFFGVRIAENTPPGVRLATLGAIAAGVAILGVWLERRLPAFGRLISAGGLALGYLVAFAAYALEATKVIENPALGFIVQALAVVVVVAWSWWKRDEAIATMAVVLGFVACAFSHHFALDHFVIAGLLCLAAAGGALLVLRGWRWPCGCGMTAAWAGFLVLGISRWAPGEGPGFMMEFGSLAALVVILEAASFLDYGRRPAAGSSAESERWRRRLTLANTSLAISIGWLVLRMTYPPAVESSHISTFYLGFAAIIGLFAGTRLWKSHPVAITETYFLKAAGLLALFFIACFEGPTRWLSLSGQVLAMLFVWRRSRLKWVEAGIAALFLGTVAVVAHDIVVNPETFQLFGIRSGVGLASLTLLTTAVALHGAWTGAGGAPERTPGTRSLIRFGGAALLGAVLVLLAAWGDWSTGETGRGLLLSIGALVVAAPGAVWRQPAPLLTGLIAFSAAVVFYAPRGASLQASDPWVGTWLLVLAFVLAELARRFWRRGWRLGNEVRTLLHVGALFTVAFLLHKHLRLTADGLRVAGLFGATAVGALALIRQGLPLLRRDSADGNDSPRTDQWFIAAMAGCCVTAVSLDLLADVRLQGPFMALAAAGFFLCALRARNVTVAVAGGIPLVVGVGAHLLEFNDPALSAPHLLAAGIIVAVCTATAWVVSGVRLSPKVTLTFDAILHALSIVSIHWWFRTQFPLGGVLLADTLLALAMVAVANRVPLQSFPMVSSLPVLLAVLHLAVGQAEGSPPGARLLAWGSALALMAWFVAGRFRRMGDSPVVPALRIGEAILTAVGLSFAGHHMLPTPWTLVSLGGVAVAMAMIGRACGSAPGRFSSLIPLATAAVAATDRIVFGDGTLTVISVAILGLLIAGHGVVLFHGGSRTTRHYAWGHGVVALGLVFAACAADRLGIDAFTTVCWGVAAITLFVIGLVAGIKPYRLTGLGGLGLAMIRMFIVDIEDPLYRIYAFFVMAAVLLGVGYLYHRFRHFISRADGDVASDGPASSEPSGTESRPR